MKQHQLPAVGAHLTQTEALLLVQFGGRLNVPVVAAGHALGLARQTVRNRITAGTFPVPTFLVGSRRFVRLFDLASFIDALGTSVLAHGRGRPTKAQQVLLKVAANDAATQAEGRRDRTAAVIRMRISAKG